MPGNKPNQKKKEHIAYHVSLLLKPPSSLSKFLNQNNSPQPIKTLQDLAPPTP